MSEQTPEEIETEYMAKLGAAAEYHRKKVARIDAEREAAWSVAMFNYWKVGERIGAEHKRKLDELEGKP